MKDGLKISDNLSLPLDIITDTIGILAIKGSGKTYTFLALTEEMIRANLPVIILDTMGVCWGLRSSANGKNPGLPITILGGSHGDVPLESSAGKVIADWIVSERQPAILDISEFSKNEALRFTLDFTTRLFQINHEPLHLVIDEADEWAPQRPFREEARTLRAFEVLVRRGRARGVGVTLVTQRPATLNKNVLTQVSTLIVGRMIAPQDRKAVQLWIEAHGTEKQKEEFWESLASISTKEKWIWSPARGIFKRVIIRQRETFDSSKTPEIGKIREPKSLAEVDLNELKKRIASTIEKAKQEDPRELRRRIIELQNQLQKKPMIQPKTKVVEKIIKAPILKNDQISRLEKIFEQFRIVSEIIIGAIRAVKDYSIQKPIALSKIREVRSSLRPIFKPQSKPEIEEVDHLRLGERRMLDVLCRWYPLKLTKSQLATLSRLKQSGTFSAYYGTLKRNGLLNESGRNEVQATEKALAMSNHSAQPQTTDEIVSSWRSVLRLGERNMLDVLIEVYPKFVTREELAEGTNLTVNTGTFSAYLGTLRRNGLAQVIGNQVAAGEVLFIGGK